MTTQDRKWEIIQGLIQKFTEEIQPLIKEHNAKIKEKANVLIAAAKKLNESGAQPPAGAPGIGDILVSLMVSQAVSEALEQGISKERFLLTAGNVWQQIEAFQNAWAENFGMPVEENKEEDYLEVKLTASRVHRPTPSSKASRLRR